MEPMGTGREKEILSRERKLTEPRVNSDALAIPSLELVRIRAFVNL